MTSLYERMYNANQRVKLFEQMMIVKLKNNF